MAGTKEIAPERHLTWDLDIPQVTTGACKVNLWESLCPHPWIHLAIPAAPCQLKINGHPGAREDSTQESADTITTKEDLAECQWALKSDETPYSCNHCSPNGRLLERDQSCEAWTLLLLRRGGYMYSTSYGNAAEHGVKVKPHSLSTQHAPLHMVCLHYGANQRRK